MFSSLADVLRDMRETAQAHEQWAMTPDASTSEAGTSTAFAAQIKKWLTALSESLALSASRTAQAPQQEQDKWFIEQLRLWWKRLDDSPKWFHAMVGAMLDDWESRPVPMPERTELAAAQARIRVLETSVDYLRYLVDHPVTNQAVPQRFEFDREATAVLALALRRMRLSKSSNWIDPTTLAIADVLQETFDRDLLKFHRAAAPPVAPAEGEP